MADPYWGNVVALLPFNGSDGATTTSDSSDSAHTVTLNGGAELDTAIKKYGTASLLLDGTNDYASLGDSADFDFGSGDFCIEMDYYGGASEPGSAFILASNWDGSTSNQSWRIEYSPTLNAIYFWYSTTGADTGTANFDLDTDGAAGGAGDLFDSAWHHIAVVRTGSTIAVHFDGVPGAGTDGTNPTLYTNSSVNTLIGAEQSGGGIVSPTPGQIDNFRITKGRSRYRAGVKFQPPVREHELGDTGIDAHFSDVKALIKFEGTDGSTTFEDLSSAEKTITANGAEIDTAFSKFGSSSLLCNLANKGVNIGSDGDTDLDFDAVSFTIDFWYRESSEPGSFAWFFCAGNIDDSPDSVGYGLGYVPSTNQLQLTVSSNGTTLSSYFYDLDTDGGSIGPTGFFDGTFHHIAVVRSGETFLVFIDGEGHVMVQNQTLSLWFPTTRALTLPGNDSSSTPGLALTGSYDDFRVTRGVARYNGDFAVPTTSAPITDGTGGGDGQGAISTVIISG